MKAILKIIRRTAASEILIITGVILLSVYYFGKPENRLSADGKGYYDYLPSAFIRHDLIRYNKDSVSHPEIFRNLAESGVYVVAPPHARVDKYFCGTAVLMSPFFLAGKFMAESGDDGYSEHFQQIIFISTLFYLFLSLIFFRKLLETYNIPPWIIFGCQVMMVFATSALHYTCNESSFSHIYSLFAINAFFYVTRQWLLNGKVSNLIGLGLLFGLIIIIRPVNGMILFFIPFLAESGERLLEGLRRVTAGRVYLIASVVCCAAVITIQCTLWYLQTGRFVLYSYNDEGFDFLNPHMLLMLFSYQKGLFVYAPVLLLIFPFLGMMLIRRQYYIVFTWTLFFLFLVYVLSSWHSWSYGSSFGQRPFIDYYAVFFLPVALLIHKARRMFKVALTTAGVCCIYIAVVQIYQYKNFILHWYDMNETKYWNVFLHTEDHYRGYAWKMKFNDWEWKDVQELNIAADSCDAGTSDTIFRFVVRGEDFDRPQVFHAEFDGEFNPENTAVLELNVRDSASGFLNYSAGIPVLHYADSKPGIFQRGSFNYSVPIIQTVTTQIVTYTLYCSDRRTAMKNVTLMRRRWR